VNILLTSHRFFPDIGGTETVTELLAEEFSKAGHKTVVVTQTLGARREAAYEDVPKESTLPLEIGGSAGASPYQIVRRPNIRTLLQLCRWSDVVLQNQVGLRTAWSLVFVRRPWVIAHHNWVDIQRGPLGWLKRRALRLAENVAASQALADRLPVPAKVIPNPYRKEVFRVLPGQSRQKDLIFVGRLIHGKGVHVLIEAMRELERRGVRRELTVVGDGPQLAEFTHAAEGLPVKFVGAKRGCELSELMVNHRILVFPSIDPEPFGIVAIEGLACGCGVVASRNAGLIEAVGEHGVLCEPGDPKSLANAILESGAAFRPMDGVAQHLARHDPEYVANEYLKALEAAIEDK
jgi:glycosyltransferase involved in cell wall biosynthesis